MHSIGPQFAILFLIMLRASASENGMRCNSDEIVADQMLNASSTNFTCKNYSATASFLRKKCCPLSFSYDVEFKNCVETGQSEFLNRSSTAIGLRTSSNFPVKDHILRLRNINFDHGHNIFIDKRWFSPENYCIDRIFNSEDYVVRTINRYNDVCNRKNTTGKTIRCLRKCCPDGQCYFKAKHCTSCTAGLNLNSLKNSKEKKDDFAIIHGSTCKKYVGYEDKYDFYLDGDGNFHIKLNKNPFYSVYSPDEEMYCLEHVENKAMKGDYFFICFQSDKVRLKFKITRIGSIISCIFLLLTLIGYGFLPEMQNLFGKTLMCYCSALFMCFLLVANLQFNENISKNKNMCAAYGFFVMCTSLASFAWLNTICFDIWWTFGRIFKILRNQENMKERSILMRHSVFDLISQSKQVTDLSCAPKGNLSIQHRQRERKRFIWYNVYGWGVPILWTALTSVFHYTHILPEVIHPRLGKVKCYFEKVSGNYGYQIFFVVPITIIFICNAILFIKTVIYCMKVKSEINKMNDTNAAKSAKRKGFIADKEKTVLFLKLFIVMGISWSFEAVSSIISFEDNTTLVIIEIIWDTLNSLQGLFIFCIFICKKKILEAYRKKLGYKNRRQSLTSGATHSTTLMSKSNNGTK